MGVLGVRQGYAFSLLFVYFSLTNCLILGSGFFMFLGVLYIYGISLYLFSFLPASFVASCIFSSCINLSFKKKEFISKPNIKLLGPLFS